MSLQTAIRAAMITAMKNKDAPRKEALSFLVAEMQATAIDKRVTELSDPEAIAVLNKQVKIRDEELKNAKTAQRDDLASKAEFQAAVIKEFLPATLSEAETRQMAQDLIATTGAASPREMGKVMAEAGKSTANVDKALLSRLVKELLS